MKLAYLLLCHNHPSHIGRLVRALSEEADDIYIHFDAKTEFSSQFLCNDRVFTIKNPVEVFWGEFSQVEAILRLMRQALSSGVTYDYLVLMSGSDYPIHHQSYIHTFFKVNYGCEFINTIAMPNDFLGKPLSRITEYRELSTNRVLKCFYENLVKINRFAGGGYITRDYRQALDGMAPYAGSTWWALTSGLSRYILDFIDRHGKFVRYFKNTRCPDEMFFQTIIGNSAYRENVRHNLTYVDWERFGPPFPAWINDWHVEYFANNRPLFESDAYGTGELLFARKFSKNSGLLTEKIDKWRTADG